MLVIALLLAGLPPLLVVAAPSNPERESRAESLPSRVQADAPHQLARRSTETFGPGDYGWGERDRPF